LLYNLRRTQVKLGFPIFLRLRQHIGGYAFNLFGLELFAKSGHGGFTVSNLGNYGSLRSFVTFFERIQKQGFFWLVLLMLILILVSHLGINPLVEKFKLEAMPKDVMESVFADRFSTWHGISSIAYLLECFLGVFAILKIR
jgi:hypothetical protein